MGTKKPMSSSVWKVSLSVRKEWSVMKLNCDFPENHDDQRVMRASLARNMSRVNCFKWIKCCEPISINNDYYQAATNSFISIKILIIIDAVIKFF